MGKILYLRDNKIEIITKPGEQVERILYILSAEHVDIDVVPGLCICMIYPVEWSKMMTPWRQSDDPVGETGLGAEYAKNFMFDIVDMVERSLVATNVKRGIAGYSLGGLMALYMGCTVDGFDFVGSISGSLWYEGALEYFTTHSPLERVKSVYFSLGAKEHEVKDARRSQVAANTKYIYQSFFEKVEGMYETNAGGHFSHIKQRIEKCIKFFLL